jgi:predicted amidohydrolase YtcJ
MTHLSNLEANVVAPGLPVGRYRIELSAGRIRRLDRIEEPSAMAADPARMPGDHRGGKPADRSGAMPADHRGGMFADRSRASEEGSFPGLEVLGVDEVLLPAFVDAHTHLLGVGTARLKPNLRGSASREEAFERLASWLSSNPGTDPVIAEGWDQSIWPDPSLPTREEIDRITRRPVALRRVCGHIAVLNSAALTSVGSGWDQVDFETGLAREALPLRLNRVWPRSAETLDRAFELAQLEAFRMGVAAIQEMGDPTSYRTYARAEVAGALRLRVNHFFQLDAIESVIGSGLVAGSGSENLRIGGIKLFLDGSIGGRTAALFQPYVPSADRGSCSSQAATEAASEAGRLLFTDDELARHLERCAQQDLPVALHAIGDRAIEQAVRTLERISRDGISMAPPGPRIEHAELLPPQLAERAISVGCFLSMQPNFTAQWQGDGGLYEQMLGRERALALNPYRDAHRSGRLLFGSDTMPLGPFLGLRGACCHPDPEQRLSFLEAVDAYTSGSARGVRRPFGNGRIAVGEPADFVALRLDVSSTPGAPGDRSSESAGLADRSSPGSMDRLRASHLTVPTGPHSKLLPGWFERLARPEMVGAAAGGLLDRLVVSGTWVNGRCVHRLGPGEGAIS